MANIADKNVLIEGSFIHAAELVGISIRIGLSEVFGFKDFEEFTTKCVKDEIVKLSKNKIFAKDYCETKKTAKRIGLTDCQHEAKPHTSVGCVLATVKKHAEEIWNSELKELHPDEVEVRLTMCSGKVGFVVATNDKELISDLKAFNPEQKIVSVVEGVIAWV